MERLIDQIIAFSQKREKTIVRICGHGASGKSTFAERVSEACSENFCQILDTDPYVIPNKYSNDAILNYELEGQLSQHHITACHPLRHELASLERDINMLRQGLDLLTIDTIWSTSRKLSATCPFTLVEGVSPTFLKKDLFDLSIWFYTDGETELTRRSERDSTERGRNMSFIRQTHGHRRKQYELYMEPYKSSFDIIVNQSADNFVVEKSIFKEVKDDY